MGAPEPRPDPRVVRQLRHDVDDVYGLLNTTNRTVSTVAATQRRHGTRLEEIQQSLDQQGVRLDRQGARLDRIDETLDQQGTRLDRQGTRLDRIDVTLDQQGTRLDRIEDIQRQILELLRGRPAESDGS